MPVAEEVESKTDGAIELVQVAEGIDNVIIFFDAATVAEGGLAAVTASAVNLHFLQYPPP